MRHCGSHKGVVRLDDAAWIATIMFASWLHSYSALQRVSWGTRNSNPYLHRWTHGARLWRSGRRKPPVHPRFLCGQSSTSSCRYFCTLPAILAILSSFDSILHHLIAPGYKLCRDGKLVRCLMIALSKKKFSKTVLTRVLIVNMIVVKSFCFTR